MAAKKNVTIRLKPETIRRAKALASRQGTSVSGLVARYLEQVAGQDDAYETARRHALQVLSRGLLRAASTSLTVAGPLRQ